MSSQAAELARRLARDAEAVCRHYLSNGRREGRYWLVGDVRQHTGPQPVCPSARAGLRQGCGRQMDRRRHRRTWRSARPDRAQPGSRRLRDALDEARAFLRLPRPSRHRTVPSAQRRRRAVHRSRASSVRHVAADRRHARGSVSARAAALRLLHASRQPALPPTLLLSAGRARADRDLAGLIAAVTDLDGRITGVHRTWLDPSGAGKAPIDTPRRAMGHLLGHGVRFGVASDVLAAGEGIETMLSLRMALPSMPMVAALSANHLAAILFPPALRRLYIARDADPAGDGSDGQPASPEPAAPASTRSCCRRGSATSTMTCADLGIDALRAALRVLLAPEDVARFMPWTTAGRDKARPAVGRRMSDRVIALAGEAAPRPSRGRSDGRRAGSATAGLRLSSPAALPVAGIPRETRKPQARRPPLRSGRCRCAPRCRPARPPSGDRHEGRDGRGRSDKGHHHGDRPRRPRLRARRTPPRRPITSSPNCSSTATAPSRTSRILDRCPNADTIAGAVADIFDALVATLGDTRLEPDLEDLLWSTVNLFHRAVDRIERDLDDNEQAQRRSQQEQDGSEVRSVELERLTAQGMTLIERRNAMELFRDQAADHFEATPARPGGRAPARWSTTAR